MRDRDPASSGRQRLQRDCLRVRIGLHTGEPVRDADDFYGKAVILAARIASEARGAEILASSLVRELTESSGEFIFEPATEAELRGLSGIHRYLRSAGKTPDCPNYGSPTLGDATSDIRSLSWTHPTKESGYGTARQTQVREERQEDRQEFGVGGSAVHYQMREKLVSIGDDFWIETDRGEKAFKVNGKALRVRSTLVFEDPQGNEVARIQDRPVRVREVMEVEASRRVDYGHDQEGDDHATAGEIFDRNCEWSGTRGSGESRRP